MKNKTKKNRKLFININGHHYQYSKNLPNLLLNLLHNLQIRRFSRRFGRILEEKGSPAPHISKSWKPWTREVRWGACLGAGLTSERGRGKTWWGEPGDQAVDEEWGCKKFDPSEPPKMGQGGGNRPERCKSGRSKRWRWAMILEKAQGVTDRPISRTW